MGDSLLMGAYRCRSREAWTIPATRTFALVQQTNTVSERTSLPFGGHRVGPLSDVEASCPGFQTWKQADGRP